MKKALALVIGAAIIIGMTYGASSMRAADKVLVCHVVGNGSAHVIDISRNALPAHLAHGDSLAAPGLEAGNSCDATPETHPGF